MEKTGHPLESHRFRPSKESLDVMKRIRDALPELQKKYPDIKGFGYFGSRTKGLENTSAEAYPGGEQSDQDLFLFVSNKVSKATGSTIPERAVTEQVNAPYAIQMSEGESGFRFSIDKADLDAGLQKDIAYIQELKSLRGVTSPKEVFDLNIPGGHTALAPLFMFAVGDVVYQARGYVLEQLGKIPEGEMCFQLLMRQLSMREREQDSKRGNPRYEHYPKSLVEGKRFFITKHIEGYGGAEMPRELAMPTRQKNADRLSKTLPKVFGKRGSSALSQRGAGVKS
jgi:hypothetical protein